MMMVRTLLVFVTAVLLPAQVLPPDKPESYDPYFPTKSYFRKHFGRPPLHVELQGPVRIGDYVVGGKLELSLKAYLDLVMANNNDITLQKVTIDLNRDAITRAFAIFDPQVIASFGATRQKTPAANALTGASTLDTLTVPLTATYNQTLETGTSFNVGFAGSRLSTNSSFATINPYLSTGVTASATQPLLRGFGREITRLPISIARSRYNSAEYALSDQVTQLVNNAESAYWNVIEARERLRVQEKSLALADTALKRTQRELELGATSPLEIFQPQANYKNAELTVVQAGYQLAQVEDALRRQMGADLDPQFQTIPVVLTESVAPPPSGSAMDREAIVAKALSKRQDLRSATEFVQGDDLNIRLANNALRPGLYFSAQYGVFGRGGPQTTSTTIINPDGTTSLIAGTPIGGGLGDALGQLFGFSYPTYGASLTLQLPIRDRRASADLADAVVNKRLDLLRAKTTEQNIRLAVLNAISMIENSQASVQIAQVARDLAQKRVEADQKRYELGTTTIFFVLASQNDLTTAESNLVRESINYRRNELNLLRSTGELLETRGIAIQ